jgi:phosphatidylserine/phosphatidylglycerophosphate/cardiolipin synthase-like enzyme
MKKVKVRSYCSPTLVLLAFDWPEGAREDFLGFAVSRVPGFRTKDGHIEDKSWLPNRVGFDGPVTGKMHADFPSNTSPLQKFMWWDARIDDPDRGKEFAYTVYPVVGTSDDLKMLDECGTVHKLRIPLQEEKGIGTYFNRAVVSSQAFSKKFGDLDESGLGDALSWLANGLEKVVPAFLSKGSSIEGAIYHMTDKWWVRPALHKVRKASIVFNQTRRDDANADAVEELASAEQVEFLPRTRANIMHNKFLVRIEGKTPVAVLAGSANFTTEGIATQANVLHTFQSEKLARLYLERKQLLGDDPTISETAKEAGWSKSVTVGDAKISVFFPPEPKPGRESLDRIVEAVKKAKQSVMFCLFSPTDEELRDAAFDAADEGKMMYGLINSISERIDEDEEPTNAAEKAKVEIYHRSRDHKDVFAHDLYPSDSAPDGFWFETSSLPGAGSKFPVYIHHKFVIIDAETDKPTVFTGSANMSGNALYRNDENLLEITGSPRIAAIYLAEFLRLYEHYRARATWNRYMAGRTKTYKLQPNNHWTGKAFKKGSPEYKSRINMAG